MWLSFGLQFMGGSPMEISVPSPQDMFLWKAAFMSSFHHAVHLSHFVHVGVWLCLVLVEDTAS